jgi:hypothetical protein
VRDDAGDQKTKMKVSKSIGLLLGSCWFVAIGIVGAQTQANMVTVAGNNRAVNLEGQGREFTVAGNHNDVHVAGETKSIRVLGNQNKVHLERVDEISVTGAQNRVSYQSGLTKNVPSVSQTGAQNRVTKGEAKASGGPGRQAPSNSGGPATGQLVLTGDDSNISRSVNAQQVRVVGDRNHVNLTGSVDELLVTGKYNSIAVERVGRVRFLGDHNSVAYKSASDGQKPEVASVGEHNSIRQAD